jgi:hypothetical protein
VPKQKTTPNLHYLPPDTSILVYWICLESLEPALIFLPIERMLEISAKPVENAG